MKSRNTTTTATLFSLIVVLMFAAGNMFGIEQFWGFNFLKFLPSFWTYLSLATALILMLPIVSKKALRWCDSFSQSLTTKARQTKFITLCSLMLLPLFLYFFSATNLLGDGTLRTNQIYKGQLWLPTEVIDFFAHATLYTYIFQPFGLNAGQCYHVVSAICGVVYVYGTFRLAYYLNPGQSLVTFLLMLSSGITVFFFGYVESYSILAALLPYMVLSGLKVVDGRDGKLRFVLWYLFGALVHIVSAVLFSAVLVIVLLLQRKEDTRREKRISVYLATFILFLLLGAYAARAAGLDDIGRNLLAPFPQPDYRQGIATVNHWLNLLNWLILSALPFLFLSPLAIITRRETKHPSGRRGLYVLWMIVPSLMFMFFFVPQLGGPRDWDLFSLPGFLLIPSAVILYFTRCGMSLPHQVIPIIFVSVCTMAGFVAVNANVVRSVDRFAEIIEVAEFKNLTKEYFTLLKLAEIRSEINERRLEYAVKVWEQPPYTKSDSAAVLSKFGKIYMEQGDSARALNYLKMAVAVDTTDLNNHLYLNIYYERFGTRQDLFSIAETLERRFPQKALGLMNAGIIFQQLGDDQRAQANLERAFSLDSTNYLVLLNYGTLQIHKGSYNRSVQVLLKALEINPKSFLANYYIAVAYTSLSDVTRAKRYLSLVETLPEAASYKKIIRDLKRQLMSMEPPAQDM